MEIYVHIIAYFFKKEKRKSEKTTYFQQEKP